MADSDEEELMGDAMEDVQAEDDRDEEGLEEEEARDQVEELEQAPLPGTPAAVSRHVLSSFLADHLDRLDYTANSSHLSQVGVSLRQGGHWLVWGQHCVSSAHSKNRNVGTTWVEYLHHLVRWVKL
jgi:hypothetical protein